MFVVPDTRWLEPLPSRCHKVNGARPLGERPRRTTLSQSDVNKIRSEVGEGGENIMPPQATESHLMRRPAKRKKEIELLLKGKMKVKVQTLVME